MSRKYSRLHLKPLGRFLAASAGSAAVPHLHTATRGQPQLAFGDHRLARVKTLFDHHVLIHAGSGNYRPGFDGVVILDYVDEAAVLPRLHSLIRNYAGIGLGGEPQDYADELAGPKLLLRVLKGALQLDCAG